MTNFIIPCVSISFAAGCIGNFINGELWGRAAEAFLLWAVVLPASAIWPPDPSQIFQFLGEGILLFIVLWRYVRKPCALGAVSGVFMMGYCSLRSMAEYSREPDAQLGLLILGMSMWQWLCVPMITLGISRWFYSNTKLSKINN